MSHQHLIFNTLSELFCSEMLTLAFLSLPDLNVPQLNHSFIRWFYFFRTRNMFLLKMYVDRRCNCRTVSFLSVKLCCSALDSLPLILSDLNQIVSDKIARLNFLCIHSFKSTMHTQFCSSIAPLWVNQLFLAGCLRLSWPYSWLLYINTVSIHKGSASCLKLNFSVGDLATAEALNVGHTARLVSMSDAVRGNRKQYTNARLITA